MLSTDFQSILNGENAYNKNQKMIDMCTESYDVQLNVMHDICFLLHTLELSCIQFHPKTKVDRISLNETFITALLRLV